MGLITVAILVVGIITAAAIFAGMAAILAGMTVILVGMATILGDFITATILEDWPAAAILEDLLSAPTASATVGSKSLAKATGLMRGARGDVDGVGFTYSNDRFRKMGGTGLSSSY